MNDNNNFTVAVKNNTKLFTTNSKKELERYILENINNIYFVKKESTFLTLSELEKELGMDLFLPSFDKIKELAEKIENCCKALIECL